MLTSSNVPIPPDKLAEIEATIADEDDFGVKMYIKERLLLRAQAEANKDALNRRRFRTALEEGQREGYADPVAFAQARVAKQELVDLHEDRVRATFRRIEARNTKRLNKLIAKHEKASKTANPNLRRLPERDRQYVEIIGEAEKAGTLSNLPLVLSNLSAKIPGYHLPNWEKTTTVLKLMAMSVECAKEGAQTINLLINPTIRDKALNSPKGPATYMQDRIRRAFIKAFDGSVPDFWFIMETDTDDRFHLHGAVVTPNVHDATNAVSLALIVAAGPWDSPGARNKQQLSVSLDHPIGWASYVCKRMNTGKTRIETKLFGSTLPLRQRAEAGWDDLRASLPRAPKKS